MARAIVVGGSMSGLMAANILLADGWDVRILERTPGGLESRGAGIATQAALLEALDRCGVDLSGTLGVGISERIGYDADGTVIGRSTYHQVTTSWALLYEMLVRRLPSERIRHGATVRTLTQDADGVRLGLADGSSLEADMVIGADGMRSTVRRTIMPDVLPRYAGYVAWRGMVEEAALPAGFVEQDFDRFNFGFAGDDELIGYPVAGVDGSLEKGRRRFNVMWYRMADAGQLRDILTDATGTFHEGGIPPHLIRDAVMRQLKQQTASLPPVFATLIDRMPRLFVQQIYDLESDLAALGRVALVGDAAFVARPHCGAGVSKAAADVLVLAAALRRIASVPQALRSYSDERVPQGRAAVAWARQLGSYIDRQPAGPDGPISAGDVVRFTGIELGEIGRVSADLLGQPA